MQTRQSWLGWILICLPLTVGAQQKTPAIRLFPQDSFAQQNPVLSPDGSELFFARPGHPANVGQQNAADIWRSYRSGQGWTPPVRMPAHVNSFQADLPVQVGLGHDQLFLFRQSDLTTMPEQLFQSGRRWNPQSALMAHWPDSLGWWYDAFLTYDGRTLLVSAAESPGQPGDIYRITLSNGGVWQGPVRLSDTINTPGHESSVCLSADESLLYFSSDGHPGIGGQDLFVARSDKSRPNHWRDVQNLGTDINSSQDDWDLFLPVAGDFAVYVSTRSGKPQIYVQYLPQFATPEEASLVALQLDKTISRDSALFVVFPTDQPRLQQVLAPERKSAQLILPSAKAYGVYASYPGIAFSPSRIINVQDKIAAWPDTPNTAALSYLRKRNDYREREAIIQNLQEKVQIIQQDIRNLVDDQERILQKLYALDFPMRPVRFLNRNDRDITNLRDQYNQKRQEQTDLLLEEFGSNDYTVLDSSIQQTPASQVLTARERLELLKQRYLQRQQGGYVIDHPLPASKTDSLNRVTKTPPTFSEFQRSVVRRTQADLFPEARSRVVAQSVAYALQEIEDQLNTNEGFILERDREALRRLLEERSIPIRPPDTSQLAPITAWQIPFAQELRRRIAQEVRQDMQATMNRLVRQYFISLLSFTIKQRRLEVVVQSLTQQIQDQRDIEIKQDFRKTDSIPSSWLISQKIPREISLNLRLRRPKSWNPIVLEALWFKPNSSSFLACAIPDLRRIVNYLQRYSNLGADIQVHTHTAMLYSEADRLSEQRATQIRQYLQQAGISADRLRIKGMGKSLPRVRGESLDDLIRNQRVTLFFYPLAGNQPEN